MASSSSSLVVAVNSPLKLKLKLVAAAGSTAGHPGLFLRRLLAGSAVAMAEKSGTGFRVERDTFGRLLFCSDFEPWPRS